MTVRSIPAWLQHARVRGPRRPAAPAADGSGAGGCLRDGRRARRGMLATAVPATAAASTLRAAAEAQGKYFGTEVTGNMINNSTITNLAGQQFDMVTPGNEMKWDTTEPSNGSYNFGPGDADRVIRQGARHAGARAQPGLAEPAPVVGVQPAAEPGAAGDGKPHHHGGQPLQGRGLRLGRRQRAVQRRRQLRQRRVLPGDGQRVHRRRAAHRARRRPQRPAVPQRLQHRGRERQEQRHVQPGAVPAGPGRADQRRGL